MTLHDRIRDEPPVAEITQVGRWTYRVVVVQGITVWGPDGYGWRVMGRKRAEKKARKVLARYLIEETRRATRWRVEVDR